MSAAKRVLRKLQQTVPGSCLCKDVLVLSPMEHIIRGFLFDRTVLKGRYYFWKFAMPLYDPESLIILSYGLRIPNDETFQISEENEDEVTEKIRKIIADGHLSDLRSVAKPGDFLEHMHHVPGFRARAFTIDVALTKYMMGEARECKDILEKELAIDDGMTLSPQAKAAGALLDDLKKNPENARRRIEGWERANIEKLGLAKAMGKIA